MPSPDPPSSSSSPPAVEHRPLDGIRVIDFSRYLPGPFCTLALTQLGAHVVVIERPPGGDPMRNFPPLDARGTSLAWHSLSRGKRLRQVDLSDPEQRAETLAACATADVVVEGFRPGVMDRLGLGYAQIAELNPTVVYCSISGYGQDGPWAQRAGHDLNYEAVSGLLSLNTDASDRPMLPPAPLADLAGGQLAATSICAALVRRERAGQGAHLDVSLAEAALSLTTHTLAAAGREGSGRREGLLDGGSASYGLYECSDGRWLSVAALEPPFFQRLCEALNLPEMVDSQFDQARQPIVRAALAARFAEETSAHWLKSLADCDCCVERVATPEEVRTASLFRTRGAVERLSAVPGSEVPASAFVIDGVR